MKYSEYIFNQSIEGIDKSKYQHNKHSLKKFRNIRVIEYIDNFMLSTTNH